MARPDMDTAAALDRDVIHPVMFAYLDILGDPVRATTAPYSVDISGTGDPDLDGHVFDAVDPTFVAVSPVKSKEGGTDTVTVQMSGLIGIDTDLMNLIGNKANWQGRPARLWLALYDEHLTRIGAIWPFHTGYMSVPKIIGSADSQTISLDIESYLAFLTQASNRSYLSQAEYDPGDLSAEASIAMANGGTGAGLTGSSGGSSGIIRGVQRAMA
ncbi:hypothetical protein [Sphingomonas montana]|uniref:hypothetical protein n=1 Tax=Sphingomonas montana TaxID=1843236 RepID=UPI00096C8F89|nr:hypothetical protein [Sphingomonas montana]